MGPKTKHEIYLCTTVPLNAQPEGDTIYLYSPTTHHARPGVEFSTYVTVVAPKTFPVLEPLGCHNLW